AGGKAYIAVLANIKKLNDDAADTARQQAQERLRQLEQIAEVQDADALAKVKATGSALDVAEAEYQLALRRNDAEASIARLNKEANESRIEALQNAKDALATDIRDQAVLDAKSAALLKANQATQL